jgi:hypothetical protein
MEGRRRKHRKSFNYKLNKYFADTDSRLDPSKSGLQVKADLYVVLPDYGKGSGSAIYFIDVGRFL